MARNARYRLPYRRRREGKTNYHLRRKLVRSNKYRIRAVVRVSNNHTLVQFVEAKTNGDITHSIAHTRELSSYKWNASTSNLPSAYLIGLLAGFKAKKAGISNAILDIGLNPPIYGSRVFAALKGIVDSGIDIPHSDKVFPDDNRLRGQHISEYATLLREKDEDSFKRQFSNLISKKVDPQRIPQIFERTKKEIQSKYV